MPQCMWRLEDELWEFVLSFHLTGSGDQIPVVRIGIKFLCPLRHLVSLSSFLTGFYKLTVVSLQSKLSLFYQILSFEPDLQPRAKIMHLAIPGASQSLRMLLSDSIPGSHFDACNGKSPPHGFTLSHAHTKTNQWKGFQNTAFNFLINSLVEI